MSSWNAGAFLKNARTGHEADAARAAAKEAEAARAGFQHAVLYICHEVGVRGFVLVCWRRAPLLCLENEYHYYSFCEHTSRERKLHVRLIRGCRMRVELGRD